MDKVVYWVANIAFVLCAAVTVSSGLDKDYDKATFFYALTLTNAYIIRNYKGTA